jgi:VirE N-terminal domain/HRDC domain/Primase C terminal 2 (PriCT-2)
MAISFTNSEYHFSLYPNLFTVDQPDYQIDINQLYEAIRYGYARETIEKLRAADTKEAYSYIKKSQLPCVTLSGTFAQRSSKGLIAHSGLIQIDVDNVQDFQSSFAEICKDDYTYLCFRSPGGKGLKAIVKINPSEETHLQQFYALERYYLDKFKLTIDTACKDLARCMLLSYDPDIYCNPQSLVFEECYMPPSRFQEVDREHFRDPFQATRHQPQNDHDLLESLTAAIENSRIDLTETHEKWIRIGYALSNEMGEGGRSFFHRIGRFYNGYSKEESDRVFTKLLTSNVKKIGLGTLFYYAKEAGIEIYKKNQIQQTQIKKPALKIEDLSESDFKLYEALRKLRIEKANEKEVEPYWIFTNDTLMDIISKKPRTINALLEVRGIRQRKAASFGKQIIDLIEKYPNC